MKNFLEYLYESGIKFPTIKDKKGNQVSIKSAKIFAHRDLDGLVSAVLTYNQLLKQGIPKENITIKGVQYGDELEKKLGKKPNERKLVAMVDFATFDSAFAFTKKEVSKKSLEELGAKQNEHKRLLNLLKTKEVEGAPQEEINKLKNEIEKAEKIAQEALSSAQSPVVKYETAKRIRPDFWSDHHILRIDYTDRKIYGVDYPSVAPMKQGRPGQTEFKSEAEHLLTKHIDSTIMDPSDIKAVSVIDSAGYANLIDTIDLPEIKNMLDIKIPENLKDKISTRELRKEKLATLINAIVQDLLNDDAFYNRLVKTTTAPVSLISIYRNILKNLEIFKTQQTAIKELEKESPNMELVNKIRSEMLKFDRDIAEQIKTGEKSTEVKDVEQIKKGKEKALKAIQNKNTFKRIGNVVIQGFGGRSLPRYLWTFLHEKNGGKYPFVIKDFASSIQISANPSMSQQDKEKIDLEQIRLKVLKKVREKYKKEYNFNQKQKGLPWWDWIFDEMIESGGGHKLITNIPKFNLFSGLRGKEGEKDEYKTLQKAQDRRDSLENPITEKDIEIIRRAKERTGTNTISDAIEYYKQKEEAGKEEKDKIKKEIIDELVKELNNISVIPLTNNLDKRFEFKENFKNKLNKNLFLK